MTDMTYHIRKLCYGMELSSWHGSFTELSLPLLLTLYKGFTNPINHTILPSYISASLTLSYSI